MQPWIALPSLVTQIYIENVDFLTKRRPKKNQAQTQNRAALIICSLLIEQQTLLLFRNHEVIGYLRRSRRYNVCSFRRWCAIGRWCKCSDSETVLCVVQGWPILSHVNFILIGCIVIGRHQPPFFVWRSAWSSDRSPSTDCSGHGHPTKWRFSGHLHLYWWFPEQRDWRNHNVW